MIIAIITQIKFHNPPASPIYLFSNNKKYIDNKVEAIFLSFFLIVWNGWKGGA
jgi:hypothetical protein